MRSNIINYISTTILALAAVVSGWFLLNNLQPLSPGLYSFTAACLIGFVIFLKLFASDFLIKTGRYLRKISSYRLFTLFAIFAISLLGLLVRLYFYFRFSYSPASDTMTFYDAALKLAQGHGMAGDSYAAFLPYLATYENVLGLAMRAISDPWLATIVLNTAFDLGAAFAIYFLVKKVAKPGSKLPLIAFAVWLLSPFNILFSLVSLPIIQVNFFIIATILLVYLLTEKITSQKLPSSLLIASLLGVVLGIGNTFRPVFIVAIVALFVLFLFIFITNKNRSRLSLILGASFLLVFTIFFGIHKLDLAFVARQTGIKPASNASGWSIYVGSNWDTDGKWNRADEIRMNELCKGTKSIDDCHKKLQVAGIERYKGYGVDGTISLFIRKLYVFSSNQSNVYNANLSIDQYTSSTTGKVMNMYIIIFLLALFLLSARFLYISANTSALKKEITPILVFIALLMLGFFLSDMFVETSERYAQIMYPMFIITAVLSLGLPKRENTSNLPSQKVN